MYPESSTSLPTQAQTSTRPAQRVMVELTMAEAEAVSHFLNGLGWGDVNAVSEIVSARRRLDTALKIEQNHLRAA